MTYHPQFLIGKGPIPASVSIEGRYGKKNEFIHHKIFSDH
jgi:hypothetical protein